MSKAFVVLSLAINMCDIIQMPLTPFDIFFLAQMKQKMESGTILMCIRGCSEILPAGRWSEMRSLNMVMVDSWLRKNLQLRTIHMS